MTPTPTSANLVRKAVISKLDFHFPDYRIYGEEVAQGFQEPCFFVKLFPVEQTQIMGRRYMRHHLFDVHYFPSSDYKNEDMHDMAEKLYGMLEYIATPPIRGTKMKHEVHQDVLHFFVEYNFGVYKPIEEIKMQTLEGVDFDTRDNGQIENDE